MKILRRPSVLLVPVLLAAALAAGQPVEIANPSFEDGDGAVPAGWKCRGTGKWLGDGAAEGGRCIAVTGSGKDDGAWTSAPAALEAGGVYVLRFRARGLGASGGTATSGMAFCNRDLRIPPEKWTAYESPFIAPTPVAAEDGCVRLGQWNIHGTVAYDDVRLVRAVPVYARCGPAVLGAGERLRPAPEGGSTYEFTAPLGPDCGNQSRPLARHRCFFNSNRWCLDGRSEVVYRHEIAGRSQLKADLNVAVGWHAGGELVVEASADGTAWTALGTVAGVAAGQFALPGSPLPARQVWIRLTARPAGGKPACSLQVSHYAYTGRLDGEPMTAVGRTAFLAVTRLDRGLRLDVDDLGEALPGGNNEVAARITSTTAQELAGRLMATVVAPDGASATSHLDVKLPPGQRAFRLPYSLAGAGEHTLRLHLAGPLEFDAQVALRVASLHDSSYGELLPCSDDAAAVWWCSSGWKVSRTRPAPGAAGQALVIRTAGNEAEAAQLVIRPARDLKGLRAEPTALAGPNGATLPASAVEVLRVRYVPVSQPTDSVGVVGDWPDPLPPLAGPMDVPAGRNQPFWVRVKAPKGAPAGTYAGRLRLSAEGWRAEAPIRVEVYGFDLPDRVTCTTAFGFDPDEVWRYHGIREESHKRAVLEKYLASFAAHRISPYNPAPLDRFKVTWPKVDRNKPPSPEQLVPTFDFSAWDAAMERAIGRYHFNTFMLHVEGMGGGTFHQRVDPILRGFAENTPEYRAMFEAYCRLLQEHLRQKGWLDEAFIYWFDEPDPKDYQFVTNGFRKLKAAAPDLNRMLTEQVEEALVGGPNIWCPISPEYDHPKAEARRKHGEKFWWYVCTGPKAPYCTLFIDHPATELRVWLWQTWQRKIDGILVWGTNYWTSSTAYTDPARPQNPYEDPMGWVSGYGTPKGTRSAWGNGDGRFIYPPEAADGARPASPILDGPVDSIRWEMLRDGIEDYEYLAILRRLLGQRGGKLPADQRRQYEALLEVPAEITRDMTTFTTSPTPIEARRHEVAKAIEAMSGP